MLQELNYVTFEKTISKGLVLVDFWADWCAPCKVQFAIIEEVAKEMSHAVFVAKIDISENRFIANQQKVLNIPTLILYKNGIEIKRFSGIQAKEVLLKEILKNK